MTSEKTVLHGLLEMLACLEHVQRTALALYPLYEPEEPEERLSGYNRMRRYMFGGDDTVALRILVGDLLAGGEWDAGREDFGARMQVRYADTLRAAVEVSDDTGSTAFR